MIFIGILIGFLFGCGLGFAVASKPERPIDVWTNKRKVRYRFRPTPMQPREWDVEDDA
jgi:hypothetical protein